MPNNSINQNSNPSCNHSNSSNPLSEISVNLRQFREEIKSSPEIDCQKVIERYKEFLRSDGTLEMLEDYLTAKKELKAMDSEIAIQREKKDIPRKTFDGRIAAANFLRKFPIQYEDAFCTIMGYKFLRDVARIHSQKDAIIITPTVDTFVGTMVSELSLGHAMYVNGGTGAGKTEAAKEAAEEYYRMTHKGEYIDPNVQHFQLFSCSGEADKFDIFGTTKLTESNGATISEEVLGPLLTAMKEGQVIILDELNTLRPDIIVALNEALKVTASLKDDKLCRFKYGNMSVDVKKGFGILATGNEGNLYKGRNPLDPSVRDRFVIHTYNGLPQITDGYLKDEDTSHADMNQGENVGLAIKANQLRELFLIGLVAVSIPEVLGDSKDIPQEQIAFKYPPKYIESIWSFAKFAKFTQLVMNGCLEDRDSDLLSATTGDGQDIQIKNFDRAVTNRTYIRILKAWRAEGFSKPLWSYVDKYYFEGYADDPISKMNRKIMEMRAKTMGVYPDDKEDDLKIWGEEDLAYVTLKNVIHEAYDLTNADERPNYNDKQEHFTPNEEQKKEIESLYNECLEKYNKEFKELEEGGCPYNG